MMIWNNSSRTRAFKVILLRTARETMEYDIGIEVTSAGHGVLEDIGVSRNLAPCFARTLFAAIGRAESYRGAMHHGDAPRSYFQPVRQEDACHCDESRAAGARARSRCAGCAV